MKYANYIYLSDEKRVNHVTKNKNFFNVYLMIKEGMMKSESLVIEKNGSLLNPFDVERSPEDYSTNQIQLIEEEDYIKNLFSLFLERVCINKSVPLGVLMNTVERSILIRTLAMVDGCQKEAAKLLGLKYTTLNEKVKKYKIRIKKSVY
jgi:transcriptional regulator with GAF, ATPase, and Fis domain